MKKTALRFASCLLCTVLAMCFLLVACGMVGNEQTSQDGNAQPVLSDNADQSSTPDNMQADAPVDTELSTDAGKTQPDDSGGTDQSSVPEGNDTNGENPLDSNSADLLEVLDSITANDFTVDSWGNQMTLPATEKLAALLRSGAANPRADMDSITSFWNVELKMSAGDGQGRLVLSVGTKDGIVQAALRNSDKGGSVCFECPELYTLIRTSMNKEDIGIKDQDAWEKHKTVTENHLSLVTDKHSNILNFLAPEVTGFQCVGEVSRLEVRVYQISYVLVGDPAEKMPYLSAGGEYVDSQFRLHPDNALYLIELEGQAAAFVADGSPSIDIIGVLENCADRNDLLAFLAQLENPESED